MKSSVNRTLLRRAHTISDKEHLPSELKHLNAVLRDNGYRPDKLKFLPNRNAPRSSDAPDKPIAVLPYIGHTSHKIQRILREADIKVCYQTRNKLETKLHTHKDRPDPSGQAGVYQIPCTCTSAIPVETLRPGSMNTRPTAAEGNVTNLRSSNTPLIQTMSLTGRSHRL